MEKIQAETKTEKIGQSIWNLWDDSKQCNIWIIRVTEKEKKENGIKRVFEKTMAKNLPKLVK